MDHCAWWKGLRRHLDEMRGCRVGTNYRIWLGKQCYKLNCHSSKKSRKFFRSGQVAALKIILSGENIFKGCCNSDVTLSPHDGRDGPEFWISCQWLKLLRKASHWQLIQNPAPSTIVWRQCDIRRLKSWWWLSCLFPQPNQNHHYLCIFLGKVGNFEWINEWD